MIMESLHGYARRCNSQNDGCIAVHGYVTFILNLECSSVFITQEVVPMEADAEFSMNSACSCVYTARSYDK